MLWTAKVSLALEVTTLCLCDTFSWQTDKQWQWSRYLQRGLGLRADPEMPIVACITRLVPQKGTYTR